jgi:hemolysin D
MNRNSWLSNPLGLLRRRYQSTLKQVEHDLELKATGLPPVAPWTKYLTQVILLGVAAGAGWSIWARVDVVINATGKLEPQSQSQAVQSKVGGTVTAVLTKEGETVKQGQLILQLDKTALQNQLQTLLMQREQLIKEIAVLRIARAGKPLESLQDNTLEIPPELLNRLQSRQLIVAQLTGDARQLAPEQQQRYELFDRQLRDRQALIKLQESNIQTQLAEADAQMVQTQFQLQTERELLARIKPLVDQGAIPKVSLLQRKVSVSELQKQLTQNRLQQRQLEIGHIQTQVEEGKRLNEMLQDLQRQLAQLDSEFDSTIKENQQQLIQVNSQLNQVKLNLKNQDLRSPVDGVVFNLATKLPGIVTQPGQPLLQIVPNESLTAQVQVANADIANIRVGMPVDVRIDAYPFTEFGSVSGTVSRVGSEAIKIGESSSPTVFPVEIRLEKQFLERQSEKLPITPGMSLVAMIKVRQRAPISYVTEEITKVFDGAKSIR